MGRHARPEPDALAAVDLAAEIEPGPLVEDVPILAEPPPDRTEPDVRVDKPDRSDRSDVIADTDPDGPAEPDGEVGDDRTDDAPYAGAGSSTVVARASRAAVREARRARNRRRALAVGGVVLAVLLVIALVLALTRSTSGGGGSSAEKPAAKPAVQHTLLVQVAGADGTAAASALVGVTPARNRAAAMLVPSRLLVDVASAGNLPFGEALTVDTPTASADALTDLLGVRVQDRWVLTSAALAALVDKVGGVQAQVDVDVTTKDAKGNETVVVRAGSQKLAGPAAAAYATFLGDDEAEQARLARFSEVFGGLVAGLPAAPDAVGADLAALSSGSTSSLSGPRLASLLTDLRTASVRKRLRSEVLPVNAIDTGSSIDTYGVDSSKAPALLDSLFAPSLLRDPSGAAVRVLVENGVGTPDLVEKARAKLVDDGFRFVNGGNAAILDDKDPSVVLIADGTEKSLKQGQRVATSLGLPRSSIEPNPRGQTVADVIVILGSDFRP
jgi:hypothetical protein